MKPNMVEEHLFPRDFCFIAIHLDIDEQKRNRKEAHNIPEAGRE